MNLLLFLSDRCNMSCDYCFLDLNHGPATVLDAEAAKKACGDHLKKFGNKASFTFLGGEPLIHYPVLLSTAQHIRSQSPKSPIAVVTNGTLLTPEKLSQLQQLNISVTVSLDGAPETHDKHRKLVSSTDSSLAVTLGSLGSLDRSFLRINVVLRGDTVAALLTNLEYLRAEGFRDIAFHPDVMEEWTDAGLATLAKALEGFQRYRKTVGSALTFSHLESIRATPLAHEYDDLVLGADGRYYPCDGLFARPCKELDRWAVGDAARGVDWRARQAWHRNAMEFVHARLPRRGHFGCARETYFRAQALGLDADPLVRSFQAVDEAFGSALSAGEAYARR